MKHEIHISDVRSFKSCRRKWHFSSPLQRELEPRVPYAPFFTGRAIHHCDEMYHQHGTPFETSLDEFLKVEIAEMEKLGKLWVQEEQTIAEQVELIRGMLGHYALWLEKDTSKWSDENLQFVALETEFSVPLRTPSGRASPKVFFAGRFDGLVVRKDDGTFWLWETKSTRSIQELASSLVNDEQCGGYMYAAQETFDVPITGVLYNIMRKKIPTAPRVLNNGYLSKRKDIDTTAFAYIDAIKSHHPDMTGEELYAEYGDILEILLEKGNTFFARIPIYRTPQEIDELTKNLWYVGLEMTRPNVALYPAPNWMNCKFCHFRSVCLAMNAGADYEFILEEEFQPRQQAKSVRYAEDKET